LDRACSVSVPAVTSLRKQLSLWDPWETHYGEVDRQMVERNET